MIGVTASPIFRKLERQALANPPVMKPQPRPYRPFAEEPPFAPAPRREPTLVLPDAKMPPVNPIARILAEVARKHDIAVANIKAPDRKRKASWARQEAMYRAAAETSYSTLEIGRRIGGRDHSTVIHGIRTYAERNGLPVPRQSGEANG